MAGMTIAEKILARTAGRERVNPGENLPFEPDYMIAYDFPGYTDRMFEQLHNDFGIDHFEHPERYVIFIDHMLSKRDAHEDAVHSVTRDWAERYGCALHEGVGIGHQASAELGYARPGLFLIHFDGHISGLGAFGALGWGVRRDLIESWATGQIYLDVPASSQIELTGEMPLGVDSRDLLHRIIKDEGADGFVGQVIEYCGPGAESLSIDQRQGICGMAMFTGAVSSIFRPDDKAIAYTRAVTEQPFTPLYADEDAEYVKRIGYDLAALEPQVVEPGSAKAANTQPLSAVAGVRLDRAFIGSCVSGRIEDLRAAAQVLRGRKVDPSVELNVVPTSRLIQEQAEREGLLAELEQAGAVLHQSSCDFCFGYAHPLSAGEVSISTGVLNVSGRMGSTEAQIYMANPYTVAASAIKGEIADPREFLEVADGN